MPIFTKPLLLLACFFCFSTANAGPLDLSAELRKNIAKQLQAEGMELRIHGTSKASKLLVGTYSVDGSTFNLKHFPLYAGNQGAQVLIDSLVRDDKVLVKGKISANRAPIPHIVATSIELLETWVPEVDYGNYERQRITLAEKGKLLGKVHAVSAVKGILIIESKDSIHPVLVKQKELLKRVIRNDTVSLQYVLRASPGRPAHLELDSAFEKDALIITRSILDIHGKDMTLKGSLARFPVSPRMRIPVFAVQIQEDEFNLYYTLVNFRNPQLFGEINQTLGEVWEQREGTAIAERNISVNPEVQIEVSGIGNILGENVANPQVIVNDVKDIKVSFK